MQNTPTASLYREAISKALRYASLLYVIWLCAYQFYPLLTGVCMWRDTTIIMNAVEAMHNEQLPYLDFLYPLTPVSLLWPLAVVKVFGLSVFSFILAQSLANVVILLCAYGIASQLGRHMGVSAGLTSLFSILWLQLINGTFLNAMVLPFYNYDWLLWLALTGYLYTTLLGKVHTGAGGTRQYRFRQLLFYGFSILAVLSNPKIPLPVTGMLWISLAMVHKHDKAPLIALGVLAVLLLLHSRLSEVPDMDKLLSRSDGYYAGYRLFTLKGMASAVYKVAAHVQMHASSFIVLLLYAGYLVYRGVLKPKETPSENRLPLAWLVLTASAGYALGAFFTHTEHAPFFEYTTLGFVLCFALMARGMTSLNLHSVLLLAMLLRLYEPGDVFKGKHGYCLNHIQETNVLKQAHYRRGAWPLQPRLKAARLAVFSGVEEQRWFSTLLTHQTPPGFMHITQPQYPNFIMQQPIENPVKGLPHWFDTHLTTNDAVLQRLTAAIRIGKVRVVQIDRFSVFFNGHRFSEDLLDTVQKETGMYAQLVFKGAMPTPLKGDSTFIYRFR